MPTEAPAHENPLRVVYIDADLLVLDKPAGLLCVPGRGPDKQDCLSARAQQQYPGSLVVHRLDMATSGLVVMARNAAVQRALSEAFAQRTVSKQYVAVVYGQLHAARGQWQTIDLPIAVDWLNRPRRVIDPLQGKPSLTRYQVARYDALRRCTEVLLEPQTGRTHQLRLHLQAIGHPIVGDTLYAPAEVATLAPRLLLHACALAFTHPVDGRPMAFALERLKCFGDYHPQC